MAENNFELSSRARSSRMKHRACFWLDALAGPSRGACFFPSPAHFLALLLACALALSAGCKKSPPPPKPGEKSAIIATQVASGSPFVMSLAMDPAQPKFAGKTTFHVTVKQTGGAAVDGAQAQVSLVMPLMDMGKNQFALKSLGNGNYAGTGEFSMAGEWEVGVTASAQEKTGKTTFNVSVME
jgi:YtkA-like protein